MSRGSGLYAALHEKTGAELLNETEKPQQLRFMMRVKKGMPTTMWLSIIDRLLQLGDEQLVANKGSGVTWTIDISKQYFRRPELKYGWRVILQGEGLWDHLPILAEEVRKVTVEAAIVEIQEIPLHGSPNRSKTAGYMGTVPLGVAAVRS
jgi:hypothetical protein